MAYHTFVDSSLEHDRNPGVIVPQKVYVSRERFEALPPIRFSVNGFPGVRLKDAKQGTILHLDHRHSIPAVNTANRITLRILWPGYDEWRYESVAVQHFTAQAPRYNMEELACTTARRVEEFYRDMERKPGGEHDWDLRRIPFDSLYLLELRRVGKGSWQPVLCYAH